jgi:hypothetical protein
MTEYENLLYWRFGRLDVIEHAGNGQWLCQCNCGRKPVLVNADALLNRRMRSCGCFWRIPMLISVFLVVFTALFFTFSWLMFGVAVALHSGDVSLADFWEIDYTLPLMAAFVLGGLATQRVQRGARAFAQLRDSLLTANARRRFPALHAAPVPEQDSIRHGGTCAS